METADLLLTFPVMVDYTDTDDDGIHIHAVYIKLPQLTQKVPIDPFLDTGQYEDLLDQLYRWYKNA